MGKRTVLELIKEMIDRMHKVALFLTFIFMLAIIVDKTYVVDRFKIFNHLIETILIIVEIVLGIILLIYWVLRFSLKNPHREWVKFLTNVQCKSIQLWLRNINYKDEHLDKCDCKFRYVGLADINIISQLNFNAFKGSPFELSLEKMKTRNKGFITRNNKCFMSMIDPIDGEDIIGYSCILPLNELGASLYKDGSISDTDLPAKLITKPSEKPSAILLFAIHLKKEYSNAKSSASMKYTFYFLNCIRLHLKSLYPKLYKNGNLPPLYVQTSHKSIERMLQRIGFINTMNISRDGYCIWEFNLPS